MPESVEIPAPVSTTTRLRLLEQRPGPHDVARPRRRPRRPHRVHASRPIAGNGGTGAGAYPAPVPGDAPTVELLHAADAEDRQRRAAGALLARGCTQGDRVAFALGSSADLICAVLGAARIGLIPVLLNATLTPAERDVLAADARPTVSVFTQHDLAQLTAEGMGHPVDLAPHPLTRPMHYTSGTTGQPKGVTTGLWDEKTAREVFEDEAAVWHFDRNDLHMVCSPMYHTVSVRFAGCTLLAGGSLAILSRFDAATALQTLRQHRPTTTFLVPTHLQRLLQQPDLGPDEQFDSLRLLAHAGAPCPESVKRAVMARTRPDTVWEFYGSTEAQFTVCPPEDWLERPGTVGRARPGRRLDIVPVTDDPTRSSDEVRRHHLVRPCRTSPASVIGTTPPPRPPPGAGRRAPSATSAASIPTTSST